MLFDLQSFVAFSMLALVIVHLSNKYVVKPIKGKKEGKSCGPDCSCNH